METLDVWASSSMLAATQASGGCTDLSHCDEEQVQFPGAIMPHGVLLVVRPGDFRIVGASANVVSWFGTSPESLAGGYLDRIVATDVRATLEMRLNDIVDSCAPRYLGCFQSLRDDNRFDVFVHRSGDYVLLEFEAIPREVAERLATERLAEIAECVVALQSAATWRQGMDIAVREIKRLTGFDSVIGVRFLADGSGQAVAEAREPNIPSFLDKRFPRSDIPEPGRRQMVLMPLQYAPALEYEPVPLLLFDQDQSPSAIDLGLSVLRSMSGSCSRYYLNMGARSRLLLSLVDRGALWGFFSCLSATPRVVAYCDRLVYQSFAAMAVLLLVEKETAARHRSLVVAKRRIAALTAELSSTEPAASGLRHLPNRLIEILDVAGAALWLNNRITRAGLTPGDAALGALIPWLDRQEDVFMTDQLPRLCELEVGSSDRATGLLAMRLMDPGQYLLGFRPEWVHEVRWAGDPRKQLETDAGSGAERLTPRGSFDLWKEVVRGTARPWEAHVVETISDLRRAVILAQTLEKRRALESLLEQSNTDLEAFAYVVSHDLQEPLHGILNFSQFLRDRIGERLEPRERDWLSTIMKLSVRMSKQITALLQYSRAGQEALNVRPVDLNLLVGSVIDDLSVRIKEAGTKVAIHRVLPSAPCDPIRTSAVFENLITNAIKYNDKASQQIDIGYLDSSPLTFFVRDNGIGIPAQHHEAIFTIFRRLHRDDEYGGGTGAGLTIVRKHIERQGGRLWLESTPGQGSTFYFTLGPGPDGSIGV